MTTLVLLLDLLSFFLVGAAGMRAFRLAHMAPRRALRRAWLGMSWLLAATLVLGTFSALNRLTVEPGGSSALLGAALDVTAASFMFGVVTLARRTARDVMKIAELENAAYTDPLTGLANRRAFIGALTDAMDAAGAGTAGFALIVIDVDHFKQVNDEYGHDRGDDVLVHVARLLTSQGRRTDRVFRTGGEEFAVIALHSDLDQGKALAERLRMAATATPFAMGGHALAVALSLGVATFRRGDSASSLTGRADEALYRAKRSGRGRVCSEVDGATVAPAIPEPSIAAASRP
ncbi:GGDEF domain-containing protein [Ancylobacter sp. TS-1]|uniref:GGDEF domain-containing protein n=1 Tax=Ancylobacter sp. TS-1 TaxID=1850374 RepID=UPI001265D534|nr:GGDEF domain-containing protein [Ancylobacter sp. TS-1]QFR31975.1 diguanylate cyclase [Ancylobacter sp. TS-1]